MENGLNHIFNNDTRVIIMGTFPSIQSRDTCYYNNPQNQFWKIMSEICHTSNIISGNANTRYDCLLKNGIGLWDVIQKCDFEDKSSSDSKIIKESIVYNDFSILRTQCPNLKCIVFNSKNALRLYKNSLKNYPNNQIKNWLNIMTNNGQNVLPSTSPANARKKTSEKLQEWKNFLLPIIKERK